MKTDQTDVGAEDAVAYLRDHAEQNIRQLDEFLRLQSVSADPARKGEVRRTAQWVADELSRIGFEHVAINETSSHPIVTADWLHAGDAPTVLVYCHYDVQPEDPLDEWVRPPFEPRYEDDNVYARGSGDDKGQLHMHLKAAEAWMATAGRLPLNLRVMFEGDEEVGSEPADRFVAEHPKLLEADICIVSDSDMYDDEGTPSITYGIRGIAYFEVRVRGSDHDLHSGQYGGGVANPANVLVRMLASLIDERGRVTIPGFYDRVRDLSEAERAAYAELPFDERDWARRIEVPKSWDGEAGYTLLERLSARPTFDINGIWGGYSGEGAKTIIPAWATAKFSTRLVPDQVHGEIERLVVEHLERIAPPEVRVEVKVIHGGNPAVTPLDHPAVQAAAGVLNDTFGRQTLFHRSGGSIPVVESLERHLGLKSVLVGFASPNGNFHAPNEWMPLSNYRIGSEALVRLWARFAQLSPADLRGQG